MKAITGFSQVETVNRLTVVEMEISSAMGYVFNLKIHTIICAKIYN